MNWMHSFVFLFKFKALRYKHLGQPR